MDGWMGGEIEEQLATSVKFSLHGAGVSFVGDIN